MGRRRGWRWLESALDAISWVLDMVMMYVAALVLIPISVLGTLKLLGIVSWWSALVQLGADQVWIGLLVLGAPAWLAVVLYVRFSRAGWADRVRSRLERAKWVVVWTTCAGLAVFAVLMLVVGR